MPSRSFFDTNVLLYLLSGEVQKAERAEDLISRGGVLSVQVLNEFSSVAVRKLNLRLTEVQEILEPVIRLCDVESLTLETHRNGIGIAERYGFSIYDSMIVAAALQSGCDVLYSEDLQANQKIKGLRITNPF